MPPRRYAPLRAATLPPPTVRDDSNPVADALSGLAELQPDKKKDDPLARIEALMRRMPGALPPPDDDERLPDGSLPSYGPPAPTRRRAFTPLEGPDTGEENPNALVGAGDEYYAKLRGPEGTMSNYDAVNPTSGAGGPFQFLPSTWADLMKTNPELGLTLQGFRNPSQFKGQHDAAIRAYTDRSMKELLPYLGRAPTMGELYALHIFGQGGGMKFLRGLDKNVAELVPDSWIAANPWMRSYAAGPGRALLKRFESMMQGSQ